MTEYLTHDMREPYKNRVSASIYLYRTLNNMSRKDLADILDIGVQYLHLVEQGKRELPLVKIIQAFNTLHIPSHILFGSGEVESRELLFAEEYGALDKSSLKLLHLFAHYLNSFQKIEGFQTSLEYIYDTMLNEYTKLGNQANRPAQLNTNDVENKQNSVKELPDSIIYDLRIIDMDISERTKGALIRKIKRVEDLLTTPVPEISKWPGIGPKSIAEINTYLNRFGERLT